MMRTTVGSSCQRFDYLTTLECVVVRIIGVCGMPEGSFKLYLLRFSLEHIFFQLPLFWG